jgi:1-acyl-sn-glycerol-3-phosphate acyltransferase
VAVNVRGALTIFVIGLAFLVGDVVQRTIITGAVKLFPARRIRILSKWQHMWAAVCIGSVRHIGGAKIQAPPKFEAGPGTLIVMNHQSVLDIPLVVSALRPTHPRIVTRARYAHGKPLISHMVRLYQYPTVDPRAMTKDAVRTVARRVASSPVPVVIYPEGTRSRTGNIASFRRAGLSAILAERSWTVHVLTIDGYWSLRTMDDFLKGSNRIRGRMKVSGPWISPDPDDTEIGSGGDTREDPVIEGFIQTLEQAMRDDLEEIRSESGREAGSEALDG